jgi:hypothetical protein
MTKKAVLIYSNNGWSDDGDSIAGYSDEVETWAVVPLDHSQYSEIMTYVKLISGPDDHLFAEHCDYDLVEAYQVSDQILNSLTKSYNITTEVFEA